MTDAPVADRVVAAVTDLKKFEGIAVDTPYWVEDVTPTGFKVWFNGDRAPIAYMVNINEATGTIVSWSRPILVEPAAIGLVTRMRLWLYDLRQKLMTTTTPDEGMTEPVYPDDED